MQHDFWHEKWKSNQIGFHLPETNPLLVKHLPALQLNSHSRIFLPLCGKTLDIHWLLSQGYRVSGAELSSIAVEALFEELKLVPTITKVATLTRYSAENIDIFNGDFFELTAKTLGKVDAIYDRAALVALPETVRKRYTQHLVNITHCVPQLLVCFEYNPTQHDGPPFSISAHEVTQHYQQQYSTNLLASIEVPGGLKGKCPAHEQVWQLTPHK